MDGSHSWASTWRSGVNGCGSLPFPSLPFHFPPFLPDCNPAQTPPGYLDCDLWCRGAGSCQAQPSPRTLVKTWGPSTHDKFGQLRKENDHSHILAGVGVDARKPEGGEIFLLLHVSLVLLVADHLGQDWGGERGERGGGEP